MKKSCFFTREIFRFSAGFVLAVLFCAPLRGNTYVWTGAANSDWHSGANWDSPAGTPAVTIPGPTDDVEIPSVIAASGNNPVINAAVQIASLLIDSGASVDTRAQTITVAGNLVNNGVFIAAGSTTSAAAVSGAGTWRLDGSISTTGAQNYGGSIVLDGTVTLVSSGGGLIFNGPIDGAGQTLFLASGSGGIMFTNDITLGQLNTPPGNYPLSFNQGGVGQNSQITAQLVLDTTGKVSFGNSTYDRFTAAGGLRFNAVPSEIVLGGNLADSTAAGISFPSPVTLEANAEVSTGGDIRFLQTLDCWSGISAPNGALSLNAASGSVEFAAAVGTLKEIQSLAVTAATIAVNGGGVTTTGAQTYTGAVTLGANTVFKTDNGGINFTALSCGTRNITFAAGTADITITGSFTQDTAATFTITTGNVKTGSGVFTAGSMMINGGSFTQTGNNGANENSVANITLSGTATMDWDSGSNGGTLRIRQAAVPFVSGLNYHAKTIFYGTPIPNILYIPPTRELTDLIIPAGTNVLLSADLTVKRNVIIFDGGTYVHNGKILTLGGAGTIDGTIRDYNTSVKQNLGAVAVQQAATSKTFADVECGTLAITATTGKISLGGTLTVNSGSLTFPNEVILTADASVTTANADLTFNAAVTNAAPYTLALTAGSGKITFEGTAGAGMGLAALSINGTAGIIVINGGSIATDGAQTYGSAVTLGANTTLAAVNGDITFSSSISNTVPRSLTISAGTGTVSFGGAAGSGTELASIAVTAAAITLNGGSLASSGAQNFNGAVTLGTDTTLTTADSTVAFSSTVANATARSLTISAGTGNASFGGAVGSGAALSALAVTAANITFNGNLTANALTLPNSANLFFRTTTTGTVTINVPQNSFSNVTGTIAIGYQTFAITYTTTFTNGFIQAPLGGSVTLAGSVSTTAAGAPLAFSGGVRLAGTSTITLTTVNGSISFASTVNSNAAARSLTLQAGSGTVILDGNVGSTAPNLASLSVTAANITINATDITSTGNQTYIGAVASTGTAAVSLTAANIEFGGSVTLPGLNVANANVYVSRAAAFAIGGGAASATDIAFPANLFIAAGAGSAVSFAANQSLNVGGSFVLFSGTVTLPGQTAITKDFIALNGTASVINGPGNIYSYNLLPRYGAAPSVASFPASLPGGSAISHTSYAGALTDLQGKTLTVGQNFYVNGVDLSAGANWSLKIPDNKSSADVFAEAYRLTVDNCITGFSRGADFAWIAAAVSCTARGSTNTNVIDPGAPTGWATANYSSLLASDPAVATGESGSGTYTIYDNIIRAEFTKPVENSNNEIWNAAQNVTWRRFTFDDGARYFGGAYTDPSCTIPTTGQGDLSVFYLRTGTTDANGERWNTDATGAGAGDPASTDRGRPGVPPANRAVKPSLSFTLNNILRDPYKNRLAAVVNHNTADRCRPVLAEVRTGQEAHKANFSDQKPHDAHNFIELRYSEPVFIAGVPAAAQNIRATAALGAIDGVSGSAGLKIAGIADIASGRLVTGSREKGSWVVTPADNTVHALYRSFNFDGITADVPQTHRLRISIAGWQDGSTGLPNGQSVPYYPGYIDAVTIPAAAAAVAVPIAAAAAITDTAAYKNPIEATLDTDAALNAAYGLNRTANHPKAAITVNGPSSPLPVPPPADLYGNWDTKAPAPARVEWSNPVPGDEIIGSANAAGFITQFEFHFFDNEPNYALDTPTWNWRVGWEPPLGGGRPDTSGGSRPLYTPGIAGGPNTAGGLRAGSLAQSWSALEVYDESNTVSNGGFIDLGFERFITETFFFGSGTNIIAQNGDSLYFSVTPQKTNLAARDTYTIRYNGYITDLAGNRAKSDNWLSTDRIPPKITLTVTPLDERRMLVYFDKPVDFSGTIPDSATMATVHSQFIFHDSTGAVIPGLTAVAAHLVPGTVSVTAIVLELSRPLNFSELVSVYISLADHTLTDPITGNNITASNITDAKRNWMKYDVKIPVTYLGVGLVRPLFATNGLAESYGGAIGVITIREPFNGDGSLYDNREIFLQTALNFTPPNPALPLELIIDANPAADAAPVLFNRVTGRNINFWLPTLTPPLPVFAERANGKALPPLSQRSDSSLLLRNFTIPVAKPPRADGDLMQFLFQYGTFKTPDINGNLTVDSPFYLVPPAAQGDPLAFSLFAFKVLGIRLQRGGATILNNVINPEAGEETILEIDIAQSGNLNISVMTLDGSIITYLHRGRIAAGKHYFRWNGTNNGGRAVARGLYFIRISGTGIDETRKVLVTRN